MCEVHDVIQHAKQNVNFTRVHLMILHEKNMYCNTTSQLLKLDLFVSSAQFIV